MKKFPIAPAFALSLGILSSGHAHAHLGHIGELAGHSHWIALGAAAAAAAIAAALAKTGKGRDAPDSAPTDAKEADA